MIDRHATLGSSVEPNAHLLEVAQLDEVLAVGQLFEGQIAAVKVGQRVRVRVASYPEEIFAGAVERVGSALDPVTHSLPLYVRVQNPGGRLLPRMRAELAVVTSSSASALAVPRGALLGDFGNEFVFVEIDPERGLFQRTPIVRGISDDQFIEVIDGLLPGDRVVTVGNYSLQFLPPFEELELGHDEAPNPTGKPEQTPSRSRRSLPGWLIAVGVLAALAAAGAAVLRSRRPTQRRA